MSSSITRNSQSSRLLTTVIACLTLAASSPGVADEVSFSKDVAPILLANCLGCHDAESREGGYDLSTFAKMLKTGDSGETIVTAGSAEGSELLRRLVTSDEDERMPAESDALPAHSVALIRDWISQGANYDAKDTSAPLSSLLPIATHPSAPNVYARPIPVTAIAFHGDQLLVGGYHEVLLWDVGAPKIVARIGQIGQRVHHIEPLVDNGRIAVACGTPGKLGEVRILDLDRVGQGSELIGVPVQTSDVLFDVALSPDGKTLATCGADNRIHLIDVAENRVVQTITSHSDWVRAIAWNPQGDRFVSASRDKTAKVFDVQTGRPIANYSGHQQDVFDVAFSLSQEGKITSCDATGKVHHWKPVDEPKATKINSGGERAFRLLPVSEGTWVTSTAPEIALVNNESKLKTLGTHSAWVTAIAISPDEKLVATGDMSGRIRIWDVSEGRLATEFVAFPVR